MMAAMEIIMQPYYLKHKTSTFSSSRALEPLLVLKVNKSFKYMAYGHLTYSHLAFILASTGTDMALPRFNNTMTSLVSIGHNTI